MSETKDYETAFAELEAAVDATEDQTVVAAFREYRRTRIILGAAEIVDVRARLRDVTIEREELTARLESHLDPPR
jgi:hypothetical protein